MGKCRVKTHAFCAIDAQEYEQIAASVRRGSFLYSQTQALTALKDQCEVNVYQEVFSVPMKRNIFGLLQVEVCIDHTLCRFILDTGAQLSSIRQSVAERLSLPLYEERIAISGIGQKRASLQGTVVDSLQFGAREYRRKALVVLADEQFSLRFGSIDLLSFDGLLGWDILSGLDFELDDIAHTCKVLKNRFRFLNRNLIAGGFPLLLVRHADKTLLFGFDSGSKRSWLGEAAARQHGWKQRQEVHALGFGVHGMEKLQMKLYDDVTLYLDRAEITLRQAMSGPVQLFDSFTFDGMLGNEIMKGRRIRFVNSRGMVLLA